MLSHVMRYDLDPRRRSYRSELINLHYDRLHNPDNCYHIRIDWMNATTKFIEDAVAHWALTVERHGLRLVQLPIAEAADICKTQPFRSPYRIELAVLPPLAHSVPWFNATSFGPQRATDRFIYQKLLLKKMQFVLDIEAASSFPTDLDVSHSWGRLDYKYSQYIHKSGMLLAQITDDGHFLLLANRLFNNRSFAARDVSRLDNGGEGRDERHRPHSVQGYLNHQLVSGLHSHTRGSPITSPASKPVAESHSSVWSSSAQSKFLSAEEIKDSFEAICSSADGLKAFYEEAGRPQPNPSPSPHLMPEPDSMVPNLKLPPNVSQLRDPSPGSLASSFSLFEAKHAHSASDTASQNHVESS